MWKLKIRKTRIILPVVLVLILAAAAGVWYQKTHVFVNGDPYSKNSEVLDLRGSGISIEYYEDLCRVLPDCDILWEVPFQGQFYPENTQSLSVKTITTDDVDVLKYFPDLTSIDAAGCTDYDVLMELRNQHPETELLYNVNIDCQNYPQDTTKISITSLSDQDIRLIPYLPHLETVEASGCDLNQLRKLQETYPNIHAAYSVPLGSENFDRSTTTLTLEHASLAELTDTLWHLTSLKAVHLTEPVGTADELQQLTDAYSHVDFTWDRDVLGISVSSTDTEVDLSGTAPDSLEQIAEELAWFPAVEKLILCDLNYDNETMAAFREKMRPEYKVVWYVDVGYLTVRTDETYYMPGKHNLGVTEEQAYNLRYCEDMVCIDVGHKPLFTCEWAAFMPNLKYLIIADTMISDISSRQGLPDHPGKFLRGLQLPVDLLRPLTAVIHHIFHSQLSQILVHGILGPGLLIGINEIPENPQSGSGNCQEHHGIDYHSNGEGTLSFLSCHVTAPLPSIPQRWWVQAGCR